MRRLADAPGGRASAQNRKAKFEEEAQARAGNTGMSRYGQQEVCPYSGVIVNKVRHCFAVHAAGLGACHCSLEGVRCHREQSAQLLCYASGVAPRTPLLRR